MTFAKSAIKSKPGSKLTNVSSEIDLGTSSFDSVIKAGARLLSQELGDIDNFAAMKVVKNYWR